MKSKLMICAAIAALCSCSSHQGWKVEGTVAGAPEGAKLALEGFNGARWYAIDSLELSPAGAFAYTADAPAPYAEVMRLGLDGKNIYFPIDSIDAVTVRASAQAFDSDYELSGTQAAADIMAIDKLISKAVADKGLTAVLADSTLKADLNQRILADDNGVVAYYVINKTVGGMPLYNPASRKDLSMIGAIANRFKEQKPTDPRTEFLVQRYLYGRQANGMTAPTEIEAQELGLFEIDLYDVKGQKRSLQQTAADAGITLLSFTTYDMESALPYNVELNRIYELFKPSGLEIYQVAFDDSEVEWMQAASNLPWVAVRVAPSQAEQLLLTYNVGILPLTYVIDSHGDLVERVENPADIEKAVRKHLR